MSIRAEDRLHRP